MSRYFALNELDILLEKHLDFDGGVFFEAGANDGENQSNTCYFERERGWTGVLVEPIVERFKRCREVRPQSQVFWSALVPPQWPDPFVELTYCNLMTVTNSELTCINQESHLLAGTQFLHETETVFKFHAPARTISSILTEAKVLRIDLCSIDLEGFEAPALRGIDLDKVDIRHFIIECWDLPAIKEILGPNYEIVAHLTHQDYLFKKT